MKLYLRTFGCRANQYDTEMVRALALSRGATIVDRAEEADVALFNSCAVTMDAEADLRQQVRRAARANPGLRSVVMGCASALPDAGAERSIRALPSVSHAIAGADMDAVTRALELERDRSASDLEIEHAGAPITHDLLLAGDSRQRDALHIAQSGARGLLRIQDGCDEHCTFCATTLARGRNRSRSADDLLREAQALAEHHDEIVLTGVHIGTWGADLDRDANVPSSARVAKANGVRQVRSVSRRHTLGALVERLVREVPSARFRLTSIEATEVDLRLAELLTGDARRVAPHLHAPLQSGSDRVLKRMGRHWYSPAQYAAAVERLASRNPVFALGADVITGFPGETDADHAETMAFVRSLPFTSLHVFPYSPREGTGAARLPGVVAPQLARDRARALRAVAAEASAAHRTRRAGQAADVVVVRSGPSGHEGLTEDYLPVSLDDGAAPRGRRFDARLELRGDALHAASVAT